MQSIRWSLVLGTAVLALAVAAAVFVSRSTPHSLIGVWTSTPESDSSRPFVFEVWTGPHGKLAGRVNSNARALWGLPFDRVTVTGRAIVMTMSQYGLEFSGQFSSDETIRGSWHQARQVVPLVLRRGEPSVPRRLQEPVPPFPHDSVDLTFENKKAGVRIAGTLTRPRTDSPTTAVLLTPAIGMDRNQTAAGHRGFLVLANYLTRRGFAVFRVDGRGVGGSGGSGLLSTTMDFADDALAGVRFLKRQPGIDPARIGLMGQSEGGLIAALAARGSTDVAFVVMIAPSGLPLSQDALLEHELIGKAAGHSPARISFEHSLQQRIFEVLRATPDNATAVQKMDAIWENAKANLANSGLTPAEQASLRASDAAFRVRFALMPTPWERYILDYDPAVTLRQLHCPILVIGGMLDQQTPPRENFPAIKAALEAAQNSDVTFREMPGLNHAMQAGVTGAPSEYARIEETFDPAALAVIGDWLEGRFAGHD